MSYNSFLNTPSKKIWEKIGISRRSGVVVPLFSIYSKNSIGIGEIPDLKMIVDWCVKSRMSIIQLLPLNELGYDSAPYNSISTFALEPAYLRLQELKTVDLIPFKNKIKALKTKFTGRKNKVDYAIKNAKLDLLFEIYKSSEIKSNGEFRSFESVNEYWLKDYAVYKVLKETNDLKSWEEWKAPEKRYSKKTVNEISKKHKEKIYFHYWLQWQLYEQMKDVKIYAAKNGVFIMGDMPFLVSRDSADVWSHRNYFKLNLTAGAPPDMYFAFGQKWGMPPYNWQTISKDEHVYLKEKIKYAENFYHMYRIDHFVGLFRIWTIGNAFNASSPADGNAVNGRFDPERKSKWELHGKKIINALLSSSAMLPCAEDLGTVPDCSYKTLKEYGIPGIDFQRFNKKKNYDFYKPSEYRKNSSSVISTHDSSFFTLWWHYEAGTIDKALFEFLCRSNNIKGKSLQRIKSKLFDKAKSKKGRLYWNTNIRSADTLLKILGIKKQKALEIVSLFKESCGEKEKFMKYLYGYSKAVPPASPSLQQTCIERAGESASIFAIQLIQEYLFMDTALFGKMNKWSYRVNSPGTVSKNNWSLRLPLSLENILKQSEIISSLRKINEKTKRI